MPTLPYDECSEWLTYGMNGEDATPFTPTEDCNYPSDYGCDCGYGYPKPNTPYKEYSHDIPWNYVSSGSFMTDCSHSLNDPTKYYKVLYDKGTYITTSGWSACEGTEPPADIPQKIQKISFHPGSAPGDQFRSYGVKYEYRDTTWSDYYDCWRVNYDVIVTYLFTYWLFCYVDNGIVPPTPPGYDWNPDNILVKDECIPCIDISTLSKTNKEIIYNVSIENSGNGDCLNNEDVVVYLSYNGSTAINGVNFTGQTSVIIKGNTDSATFSIELLETDIERTINIEGVATLLNNTYAPSCGLNNETIYPSDNVEENYDSCCSYMAKDFVNWSDGYSVPKIEEPTGIRN